MGLSSKERRLLESLQRKAEEPDPPTTGRSLHFNIDLGDPKQIAQAIKLGLLPGDDDDDDEGDDDNQQVKEEGPRRRGYFND